MIVVNFPLILYQAWKVPQGYQCQYGLNKGQNFYKEGGPLIAQMKRLD